MNALDNRDAALADLAKIYDALHAQGRALARSRRREGVEPLPVLRDRLDRIREATR